MKIKNILVSVFLLLATVAMTQTNPPQVGLNGSVPPYLIRTFDSRDTARLGQLLGYVDYADGDTLLGLIPIYLLPGDSLLQLGKCPACDTLATRGYAAQVAATEGFSGAWADLTGIPADIADGDDDTQVTEAQVDAYVANNGYLTTEVDGSTTNEIQNLASVLTEGNNAGGQQIKNIGAATLGTDAANLAQVQAAQAAAQAYADANDATGTDDQTAAEVAFTPTGGIAATNVQAAIAEMDIEKLNTANLLPAILAVDGAGSGLDADLLDGQPGAYYLDYGNFTNTPNISQPLSQILYGSGSGVTSNAMLKFSVLNPNAGAFRLYGGDGSGGGGSFMQIYKDNELLSLYGPETSAFGGVGGGIVQFIYGNRPFHISTNSSRRFTVSGDGNVGIGTTSPSEKLDVSGNGRLSGVLKLGNGSAVSPAGQFANDPNTGYFGTGADVFGITTGGFSRFEIMSNGVINTKGNWISGDADGEGIKIVPNGNTGIGTTAPTVRLDVRDNSSTNILSITNNTVGTGANPNTFGLVFSGYNNILKAAIRSTDESANFSRGNMLFLTETSGTGLSEKMRIAHDGNVGVGVIAPTTKLDVNGTTTMRGAGSIAAYVYNSQAIRNNTTTSAAVLYMDSPNWRFRDPSNAYADVLSLSNTFVGIGTTTPGAKLDVNGAIRLNALLGTADYDRFAVIDTDGEIKYRTSSQMLSDLGISAGTPSRIEDADADTYIDVETSADIDQVRVNTGGSPALRMAKGDGQRTYTPTTQTANDTMYVDRPFAADDDAVHIHFAAKDSGGNKTVFARQRFEAGNVTNGAENGVYVLSVAKAGVQRNGLNVNANTATLGSSQIAPTVAAMNTATRDALSPATGSFIYNITTDQVEVYDAGWSSVGGSGAGGGAPGNGVYTVAGSLSSSVDTLLGNVVVHYVVHDSLVQITARVPVAFGNVSQKVLSFTPPFASNFTDANYDAFGTARYEQQGSYTGDFVSGRCLFKCNTATDKLEVHYDPPVSINAAPENHVFISISGTYILK